LSTKLIKKIYGCEVTFRPSIPGSTRWLCMEAQMLLMKEEYKCSFGN
jgi:hypothetical protein